MEKQESKNLINPIHYGAGKAHECIDVMLQQFGMEQVLAFCKLNAFKYLFRIDQKSDPVENARKAQWYLKKYEELVTDK